MAEINAQKVIDRLATKLANKEVQIAVLESEIEATRAELVEARRQVSELCDAAIAPKRADA